MSSQVPPIESGYRGSRMKATLEQNSLMTNKFCSRNNISNNILGRTTYAATNLRSYFSPPNPNTANKHPDCNQAHRSNRQWHHSACDCHAHRGSRWAESKAALRFRAQSAQFHTVTKVFLKRPCSSASQLISAIHNESQSAQNRKTLLHQHFRTSNMSGLPRIRSHKKLGISCVHRYMDRHPRRNQTIAFGSLRRNLIVYASLQKAQRSIV
jgi:hypothetical protein